MVLASLFLLSTVPLFAHAGGYNSDSVRALDGTSFPRHVPAEKVTMAVFHAPWCGHCKRLEPDYEKAAINLRGLVDFVSVDCDQEQNKRLCAEYQVKGFPTIKAFPGNKRKSPRDYSGARTAKDIADYALKMMPSYVKRLKGAKELESFLEEQRTRPASVLVTTASNVTPLYKALSTDFRSSMDFYAIKDASELETVKEKLGVPKAPGIAVVYGAGTAPAVHTGPIKYTDLFAFYQNAARSAGTRDRSEL